MLFASKISSIILDKFLKAKNDKKFKYGAQPR